MLPSSPQNLSLPRPISRWAALGAAFACALTITSCAPEESSLDPKTSITVGLLLPFTGSSAATASNFEKSVLMAAEKVNEAGGIQGKTLRIVASDTHSEPGRSMDAVDALIDEGAVAIIGPESPEVASAIRERLNDAEVTLVSPVVGEGKEVELDCDYPWYRLAPSAVALGENLAKDLSGSGVSEIAILYGAGEYNTAFRTAVRNKFESALLGGTVLVEAALDEDASSYSSEIKKVLEEDPEVIVLSTAPQMGSVVFTEANLIGAGDAEWALSPLLKTPLFLQNISTEDAEGAVGVSPKIFDTKDDFPLAFSERWLGNEPLEGAYFYYDSVNLLSIAFGLLDDVDDFSYDELTEAIIQASSSRGVSIGWDEMEKGLEKMEEGTDVHYSGLTGPILLQDCGERRSGATQSWVIENGEFQEAEK